MVHGQLELTMDVRDKSVGQDKLPNTLDGSPTPLRRKSNTMHRRNHTYDQLASVEVTSKKSIGTRDT